ncbi:winged helix-turn-helix transcriptional regulator [Sneathiella glossodoripedis]|uniref:winged helix-turn-helix transcriptional regulator n=1 Tax=Sneathiella glossodoripedis TaxID=418853 RepID=UPI0004714FD5|nr:helix-turn-helix domain-containing protein [Sneathiella glossodoripedis]
MKWNELENESCPIARALSVIGDRWTLLIIRDCFMGVTRFDQLQRNIGMTRHVLADRLKKLVEADVLEKRPYQERPVRYEYLLTRKGASFFPVLMMLFSWSEKHLPHDQVAPYEFLNAETGHKIEPVLYDDKTGSKVDGRNIIRKEN